MQLPANSSRNHDIVLTLTIRQLVTVLGPPLWIRRNTDLVNGDFVVAATTCTYNARGQRHDCGHAYLGLVPLARLLNRVVAPATVYEAGARTARLTYHRTPLQRF